ncbi:MAG: sigma-70 family RNA polymerase sigma factor [Gammaproteobacteria bacterium]|nr:sigma-70 family RNA polymerase sigma factor [Gammaproteobacteria bacterium]
MPTETELIDRIANKDETALQALHSAYYRRLARFLLRMTGDSELVLEIVNDVFLVVWHNAGKFRGDSHLSTWLIGIAYRKALKALEKARKWNSFEEVPTNLATDDSDAHNHLDMQTSLAMLSADHRAVLELTYYFGYSYKEIAVIFDCPENTVKTRMFYARRALQTILEA